MSIEFVHAIGLYFLQNGNGQGLFRSNQDDQFLRPADPCIDKVSLEKHIMLGCNGKNHDRVLAPLGLMNGYGIGQDKFIEIRLGPMPSTSDSLSGFFSITFRV